MQKVCFSNTKLRIIKKFIDYFWKYFVKMLLKRKIFRIGGILKREKLAVNGEFLKSALSV